jgi:hypothetical protein
VREREGIGVNFGKIKSYWERELNKKKSVALCVREKLFVYSRHLWGTKIVLNSKNIKKVYIVLAN